MKNTFKLAAVTLCLAAGVASSQGQITNPVSVTFAPQILNISLTGVASGTNSTAANNVRIATKDVIAAMGLSSKSAKLLYGIGTISGDTNSVTGPVFVVQSGSGKNVTNVLVTQFFSVATNSATLVKGNSASAITSLGFGMDSSGALLTNEVDGSALTPLTFLVQGFTAFQNNGSFKSTVNGPGTSDNTANALVLKGTVSAGAVSKTTININP